MKKKMSKQKGGKSDGGGDDRLSIIITVLEELTMKVNTIEAKVNMIEARVNRIEADVHEIKLGRELIIKRIDDLEESIRSGLQDLDNSLASLEENVLRRQRQMRGRIEKLEARKERAQ